MPYDLAPGIRQISGSLTVFNTPDFNGAEKFEDYCAGNEHLIKVKIESLCAAAGEEVEMRVRFHRIEPSLTPGVITSTVGFTGVSHQTGYPWDVT